MAELLISKGEPSQHLEKAPFLPSHSSSHYTEIVTTGESKNVNGHYTQISLLHDKPVQTRVHITDISRSTLLSFVNNTLRHLKFSTWVSNPEWALHPFPAENHALGLGGADSHLSCFTSVHKNYELNL